MCCGKAASVARAKSQLSMFRSISIFFFILLAAAWKLTHEERYAKHAALHLRAWFLDESTRMNPHLPYAQAIHGRFTGRGTGIIDTIHLVEVARAIEVLEKSKALSATEIKGLK